MSIFKMEVYFTCLLISICLGETNAENNSLSLSRTVDMLQSLCPGANVCPENQTIKTRVRSFSPGSGSCCVECSCSSECTKNGNCCFPHSETEKQNENKHAAAKGVACLFPTTVPLHRQQQKFYHSYYMISSVSTFSNSKNKTVTNLTCGDENVAPWGSLYPVYSAKRGVIYKNSACATADGVEDGKPWEVIINCKDNGSKIVLDAGIFVLGLESDSFSENCDVNFITKDDIYHLRCFSDVVDTCRKNDFKIPDVIQASKQEVIDICTSGLMSPYRHCRIYANVFCYICNSDFADFAENRVCPVQQDAAGRTPGTGFIGILDATFIKNKQRRVSNDPEVCSAQKGCRTVLCRSGQLRDGAGRCVYPVNIWYDQKFRINIKLTAEEYINVSEVFQVQSDRILNFLPAFESPWRKNWFIYFVYHEEFPEQKNITNFIVVLSAVLPKANPVRLMRAIELTIKRDWLLRHNWKSYVLKSSFLKEGGSLSIRDSIIVNGNVSEIIHKPVYKCMYEFIGLSDIGTEHYITTLYLCDQVVLQQSEFILSLDKTVLLNKITKKYLFEGEFSLIPDKQSGGVCARVCIGDSGLYTTEQITRSLSKSCPVRLDIVLPLVLILAVYILT